MIIDYSENTYYLFGITKWGIMICYDLLSRGKQTIFIDNATSKQGKEIIHGVFCCSPSEIMPESICVICVMSEKNRDSIRKQLLSRNIERVICVDYEKMEIYEKSLSDEVYLKAIWFDMMGYELDLKHPKTFNEKLQWLKLYDRRPEYTKMVDKYEVKNYLAEKIGEEYIIPTLGVWNCFDEINFDILPNQFVLKCTHDSGGVVIVRDKSIFDKESARKKIETSLKQNYYWKFREWPYKGVKPRIIAEKYMLDESGKELKDYKVFNFGGRAKMIEVDYDRFIGHKRNLYSIDWKYIDASIMYPTDKDRIIEKPKRLKKMLELAEKLSDGFPFLRTDFYSIEEKVLFGEMTFYHGSGYEKFNPESLGIELGNCIQLSNVASHQN